MLEAGTGVRLREEQRVSPEVQQARDAFAQVFGQEAAEIMQHAPMLLQLVQALQEGQVDPRSFSRFGSVVEGTDHAWAQHGRTQLQSIYTALAPDFGGEALTPRQQRAVGMEFKAWLEDDQTGQRVNRYTMGDAALQTEFLTEYRQGFIDPFRRNAGAALLAGARRAGGLPPAPRPGGPPPPPEQPELTEDQVHDRAWQSFAAASTAAR
jgi:hypothetical protein